MDVEAHNYHNREDNSNHLHTSHAGKHICTSVMCFENTGGALGDIPAPALVRVVIPTAPIASQEVQYIEYS